MDALQRVKASAPAFATNFFPMQKKLEAWTGHGELFCESRTGAAFFFRKDRDLWHLHFAANDPETLLRQIETVDELKQLPVTTDIVGPESAVSGIIGVLEGAGFRRYRRLQRMARPALPLAKSDSPPAPITDAAPSDRDAVLHLLDVSFDRYADLLPGPYEIEAALDQKQILCVKSDGELAAMLYFETQGLSSTLRYWAVAEAFRAKRLGSALMRHYFETQGAVRRFVLWVVAENRNAVEKYEHYGYRADGLIDHVLVNKLIPE